MKDDHGLLISYESWFKFGLWTVWLNLWIDNILDEDGEGFCTIYINPIIVEFRENIYKILYRRKIFKSLNKSKGV